MTYCSHVKCVMFMLGRNENIFHDLLAALSAGNSSGHTGSPVFICNVLTIISNLLNIGLNIQTEEVSTGGQSHNKILEEFLKQENLENLESLQQHSNDRVYETVAGLLDKYFTSYTEE